MAISYGRTDIETPIHADIKETLSHGIIVSNLAYLVGKELGLSEGIFKGKDKIVFLDVPLGIIKSRLKNDTTRPLLQRPDRDRVMKDLYDSRYPIYHAAADIVVKGKNTPLKTAFAIIDAVSGTDVAEKPHKNA